jgi:hypothetical protein
MSDPWYSYLSKPGPYAAGMHLHFFIPLALTWYLAGIKGLVVYWMTTVVLYNLGDAIDSVAHMFGNELPGQRDRSRNSFAMGGHAPESMSSRRNALCASERDRTMRLSWQWRVADQK